MAETERTDRLVDIILDDRGLAPPTPEIEQERRVAVFDLLEDNHFAPVAREGRSPPAGPYRLHLAIRDRRLVFELATEAGEKAGTFEISLTPFNQVVKDYFQICESYFDAVRRLPAAEIEAIDTGRRAIHDVGSRVLLERLEGQVDADMATARRLFTLICVLQDRPV